jgi:hypothetical protein
MATKTQPAGWGDDKKAPPPPPTIEDRLTRLETGTAQLTAQELTGLRALLDRSGFDRNKGSF